MSQTEHMLTMSEMLERDMDLPVASGIVESMPAGIRLTVLQAGQGNEEQLHYEVADLDLVAALRLGLAPPDLHCPVCGHRTTPHRSSYILEFIEAPGIVFWSEEPDAFSQARSEALASYYQPPRPDPGWRLRRTGLPYRLHTCRPPKSSRQLFLFIPRSP